MFGNTILRRYLQETKWVEDATSRKDLQRFSEMMNLFQKYGNQYDYPYLMLAAQAYQESRLNQKLKSRAGAVGVMQIKPSSAAQSPINIRDVYKLDRNIEAGAKFMRFMETQYFEREPLDDVTKSLLQPLPTMRAQRKFEPCARKLRSTDTIPTCGSTT